MGIVVLHAGIPKAGSSSVQQWLRMNSTTLRERHEIFVFVAKCEGTSSLEDKQAAPRVSLTLYQEGSINSGGMVECYLAHDSNKKAIAQGFFEKLDQAASSYPMVVISGEAFAHLFWRGEEVFLEALEQLAHRHEIRVAYYVRPQHMALEAAWRQWGFRTGQQPSQYIMERARHLRYFDTYEAMRQLIPSVCFEPRPFRKDLMDSGNIVVDFFKRFLDLGDLLAPSVEIWTNRGLPLEIINLLRKMPKGLLWHSAHDNSRLNKLKHIVGRLELSETDKIRKSRCVLQHYCHETFEEDNLKLIAALKWKTDHFVPAVGPLPEGLQLDLSALDQLWEPDASEAEIQFLQTLLKHIFAHDCK